MVLLPSAKGDQNRVLIRKIGTRPSRDIVAIEAYIFPNVRKNVWLEWHLHVYRPNDVA